MNRGSAALTSPEPSQGLGFNEAPIHESGKSCSGGTRCAWLDCFNEAPIHESGKSLPLANACARAARLQ